MPITAIETGCIDHGLVPKAIGAKIRRIVNRACD
jgi:hypothetical protein